MIRRGIAERERMEPSNLAADNERSRRGGVLLLAGPDGVGKTTLSRALEETVLVDRPLLHVHHRRGVGVLPARKPQGPTSEPHRHPPYGRLVSAGKLLYLYLDFLLGSVVGRRSWPRASSRGRCGLGGACCPPIAASSWTWARHPTRWSAGQGTRSNVSWTRGRRVCRELDGYACPREPIPDG